MIEAELKARVRDPESVMGQLDRRARAIVELYRDTYYDAPSGDLVAQDRELRVRTIQGEASTRSVFTYKGARIDEASGSKPEHETRVDDPEAVDAILRELGFVPVTEFQKHCRNYNFSAHGRRVLATLVQVPEIEGTFLEVETLVREEGELLAALNDVRMIMTELGIHEGDLTAELYTDAVAAYRAS
ncbi:class IV adenylate cyclase [Streptomyces sp. NBS 14/10]|uniref:class IV adenylate cyclase n=1 Tax=Streptomyces sp. NBS 14/10 TaxID=1945643 RepID=UPI000B7DC366|nr:class IV adenylate cyclase [Streptomyces sp. NBS 14/10]KAK1179009.1 class IV adenylate cyclase [Streptomyces sp. NBS 14/10]